MTALGREVSATVPISMTAILTLSVIDHDRSKACWGLSSDSNSGPKGGEVVKVVYFRPFEIFVQAKSFLTHGAPRERSLSQPVAL